MLRTVSQSLRDHCRKQLLQAYKEAPLLKESVRGTVIMEYHFPQPLPPKGRLPYVKEDERIYKMVERVHSKKTPDIKCILTDIVEGVGVRGQMVTVRRRMFRWWLQPAGLAVYASPENIEKFEKERKERGEAGEVDLGVFGHMALKTLSGMYLRVPMSGDSSWVLEPKHVRVALRIAGVEASEDSILLPQEPIVEPKEFNFRVTVNGIKSVMVKGRVILKHKDPSKDEELDLPPTFAPEENKSDFLDLMYG